MASSGMSLIPDPWLILIQVLPFLATLFVLHNLIFAPMIRYLEDRDAATVGAREQATRLQHDADARLTRYEAQLQSARAEVASLRAQARKEAERTVNDALDVISGERELASQELDRNSRMLAQEIADRVLGRSAQA